MNWEAEIERSHEAGFGWALRCCAGNRAEADEVLQTAYLKLLDGRARFSGRSAPRTFLFGVIRRTALERHRRSRLAALLPGRIAEPEPSTRQDDDVVLRESAAALLRAMGGLGRRQQEVLHLVFYEDLTVEGAAEVMGVTVGTARTHYARGKKRLREALENASEPTALEATR